MDAFEALKIVMSRVQKLEPENASRIMGYVLIQDQGEKEVMRLAFCPESLLLSYVNRAKACLGILPPSPHSNPSTPRLLPFSPVGQNGPFLSQNGAFHLSSPPTLAVSFPGSLSVPFVPILDSDVGSGGLGSPGFRGADFSGDGFSGIAQDQPPFRADYPAVDSSDYFQLFPYSENVGDDLPLRRSPSVNLEEGSRYSDGGGDEYFFRPCGYFARGHCKNGVSCKFLHTGAMDCLNEDQREFVPAGFDSSSSRQIYLTFPADSTFTEEDVSSYFSEFGPVQDVRIPYQQKRMFGFVTFVYSETVRNILAKKNPHFIKECRVLVKPYKEKSELRDKKRQQQRFERVLPRLIPTGGDLEEHDDIPFGPRLSMSPRAMARWKNLIQRSDIQDAVELQSQRMMDLQLTDLKNWNMNSLSGIPFLSPKLSQLQMNQPDGSFGSLIREDSIADATNDTSPPESPTFNGAISDHENVAKPGVPAERLDHFLPNNLFTSPSGWPYDDSKGSAPATSIPPPLAPHRSNA